MRIAIDMQGAQNDSRFRGIGRYTAAFTSHLAKIAEKHEILLVLSAAFPETIEPLRSQFEPYIGRNVSFRVWHPVTPAQYAVPSNKARRLVSEIIREAFLASLQPDIVLISSLFEGCGDHVVTSIGNFVNSAPVGVILYDFIPYLYPEQYLANETLRNWYYEKLEHLKKAQLLLAISESAHQEAREILATETSDIVTISSAADQMFFDETGTPAEELMSRYSIKQPYLMCTGASDPRKNLSMLIDAFASLAPQTMNAHQLVLVGPMAKSDVTRLKKQLQKSGLPNSSVLFLGRVSDADLIGLYRAARACIIPSIHEGFGLPALEAMACGAPVIGSNSSSIPEAIGFKDALFDPRSKSSMSRAIERVLIDETFRKQLLEHACKHIKLFSWESVARKGLEALISATNNSSSSKSYSNNEIISLLPSILGKILAEQKADRIDYIKTAAAVEASFSELIPK